MNVIINEATREYIAQINFSLKIGPVKKLSEDYPCASIKITTFECLKKPSHCTFFVIFDRLTIFSRIIRVS